MTTTYSFESKNQGTVEVSVTGEYRDHWAKDIDVCTAAGHDASFEEIDSADEIMQWLLEVGVDFESPRTMAFNYHYIQDILIERCTTEHALIDCAASWTDDEIANIVSSITC